MDKSTHIEPLCRARLVTRSADVSYRKSVALTPPASLSGQSVLQSIRKLGTIPNQAAVMPAAKPEIHKVYVETDEDHVAMQKHCTYVPNKVAHMPGRESTSTGEWMRLIENGGYQHVM